MPLYYDKDGRVVNPFAPVPIEEQITMPQTFENDTITFLLGQGIGDSVWGLMKCQSIAKAYGVNKINIALNTSMNEAQPDHVEMRALKFIKRFDFVQSVRSAQVSILNSQWLNDDGYYNYISDFTRFQKERLDASLMPNCFIERGGRLEDWLPEYPINWKIMDHFVFANGELRAVEDFKREYGEYVYFYLGPRRGNIEEGHNRGGRWSPAHWVEIGKWVESRGLKVVVTGAGYDREYWEKFVRPYAPPTWIDRIGMDEIAQTFAFVRGARFCLSYQSGIGIVSTLLGTPTVVWWREAGNSMNPNHNIRVEESMSTAWVPPATLTAGKYIGAFYGRETVEDLQRELIARNW